MPSLTIDPSRPPPPDADLESAFSRTASDTENLPPYQRPLSPVAPAYSPITPKVQPVLPVPTAQDGFLDLNSPPETSATSGAHAGPPMTMSHAWPAETRHEPLLTSAFAPHPHHPTVHQQQGIPGSRELDPTQRPRQVQTGAPNQTSPKSVGPKQIGSEAVARTGVEVASPAQQPQSAPSEAQFIPPPPPKPFSSDDCTDTIALRAAISALQFQKKKAIDDVRTLQKVRKQALADPLHFKRELAAGRLKEERTTLGDMRAILDASDSDEDSDEDDAGATEPAKESQTTSHGRNDSLTATKSSVEGSENASHESQSSTPIPFDRIPGPQDVIRMPYVNWDKYHILGEPLDAIHDQQRRWPGNSAYGTDRGREHSVAAPYSPFHDLVDGQPAAGSLEGGARNDGRESFSSALMTPTGTISEHPMETRRTSRLQ